MNTFKMLRKFLDRLYLFFGYIGAFFLIIILALICLQVVSRWAGFVILPGSIEYIGYSMAASTFFCLAYALNSGTHIRVDLISSKTSGLTKKFLIFFCLAFSLAISVYFSYHTLNNVFISHMINDISQGEDATPLWIPQIVTPVGAILLSIALTDQLLTFLFTGNCVLLEEGSGHE